MSANIILLSEVYWTWGEGTMWLFAQTVFGPLIGVILAEVYKTVKKQEEESIFNFFLKKLFNFFLAFCHLPRRHIEGAVLPPDDEGVLVCCSPLLKISRGCGSKEILLYIFKTRIDFLCSPNVTGHLTPVFSSLVYNVTS